ncbi:MAG: dihydrofolate reductase family protein, partial [Anaerolineae bacterium]|nr:dihydrofolate reductase family protein [Anaerolineae bacterium]
MSKVLLYIAISLDGFIATPDGGVAWLDGFNSPDEDYGYNSMYARLGAVVMGGITYRQVLGLGEWYEGVKVKSYVITRGKLENPPKEDTVAFAGDMRDLVTKIRAETDKDIWLIGGADVVAQFMEHNLIDEYHISIMPVVLGRGIALFKGTSLEKSQSVKLDSVKSYPNGV